MHTGSKQLDKETKTGPGRWKAGKARNCREAWQQHGPNNTRKRATGKCGKQQTEAQD